MLYMYKDYHVIITMFNKIINLKNLIILLNLQD